MYVCLSIHVYMYMYVHICICMYVYVCIFVYVYTNIYFKCIYVYINIFIHTHTLYIFPPVLWDSNLMLLIKMVKIRKGEFHLVSIVTKFCDYVSTVVAVQLPQMAKLGEHAWNILIHAKIWTFAQHFSMAIIFWLFCVCFNKEQNILQIIKMLQLLFWLFLRCT